MIDNEYRIYKTANGCFPQVRSKVVFLFGLFFMWGKWEKISKHPTGYGLYPSNNTNYPKSEDGCRLVIKKYHQWVIDENKLSERSYIPVDINDI